jgi:hypothetical protein
VTDGGFEAGTPNPVWEEFSTNFGTPICDIFDCGDGLGTAGPRTGDFWAWFGGVNAIETGSLKQNVLLPGPSATLAFYLWNGASSGNGQDFLRVNLDGNLIFSVLEGNPAYTAGYRLVTIDLSPYADGGTHQIAFESTTLGGETTNFSLDDVVIQTCSGSTATMGFHTVSPCRFVDTRLPDGGRPRPVVRPRRYLRYSGVGQGGFVEHRRHRRDSPWQRAIAPRRNPRPADILGQLRWRADPI